MRNVARLAVLACSLATAGAVEASIGVVPTPIGPGALYHPRPRGTLVAARRTVAGLWCSRAGGARFGAHLELFGRGLVVLVPAGIGVAPPLKASGGFVTAGGCSYPARTMEPTGVIEAVRTTRVTLGSFFALWGQPLGTRRLAGFRGAGRERVRAWVDGRLWRGDPRRILLRPHAEIVLELGLFIPPHASYRFEKGL